MKITLNLNLPYLREKIYEFYNPITQEFDKKKTTLYINHNGEFIEIDKRITVKNTVKDKYIKLENIIRIHYFDVEEIKDSFGDLIAYKILGDIIHSPRNFSNWFINQELKNALYRTNVNTYDYDALTIEWEIKYHG